MHMCIIEHELGQDDVHVNLGRMSVRLKWVCSGCAKQSLSSSIRNFIKPSHSSPTFHNPPKVRYHSIQLYDMARWHMRMHMRYELECEKQWNDICSRSGLESINRN